MRTQGIRTYALPALLATAAAALTLIYVGHGGSKDAAAAAPGTFGVYVATHDIAAGASGDEVMRALRLVHVTSDAVVPDAVTNTSTLSNRIALTSIYKGQQVTLRAFGSLRQQGLAGQLTGHERAIQIAGDPTQVLAGMLHDGDHVDVVASLKTPDGARPYGRTVLRNIVVVSAPSGSTSLTSQSVATTLRLTDAQARTLFFVAKNGDWSLVLRPAVHGADSADAVDSIASVTGGNR